MITAIYARKSTEQSGVADDQKSVARQVEHARQYAQRKGWSVDDASVFVDDGISGAEFANRPGFLRLMNSLKPRPRFQVLVMSEESRLGREAIETAYVLKQLVQAGVRVFFYLEDRERTLDSPTDKIMLSLTTFADELEREKARQRTYDAMLRKSRAGHVTGGRVFGYDNVEILSASGDRSHVMRQINPAEAAVVRRIFELSDAGAGLTRITKTLNDAGAPARGRSRGDRAPWAGSSVREVLLRPLYRGEIVWNQTRKRDRWGCRTARAGRRPTACEYPPPNCGSSQTTCGPRRRRGLRSASGSMTVDLGGAETSNHPTCCQGLPDAAMRRRDGSHEPTAWRSTRALLQLHVILEARHDGLLEQPHGPHGRPRR
jgi:DNA invertase Pin-like site-specific DNA recombinase